ncbi:hypothetical protein B0H15DRAFT_830909 [Mycena belliarum]|uniref:Uncharacterized protein n=1 Tax=Mycena belliarum TaxID=1033014 RepID=A0AAD6UAN8_9AGAR|nr:hypothetical protein B0H15DRAFT_830909 [Mycena belliae]
MREFARAGHGIMWARLRRARPPRSRRPSRMMGARRRREERGEGRRERAAKPCMRASRPRRHAVSPRRHLAQPTPVALRSHAHLVRIPALVACRGLWGCTHAWRLRGADSARARTPGSLHRLRRCRLHLHLRAPDPPAPAPVHRASRSRPRPARTPPAPYASSLLSASSRAVRPPLPGPVIALVLCPQQCRHCGRRGAAGGTVWVYDRAHRRCSITEAINVPSRRSRTRARCYESSA